VAQIIKIMARTGITLVAVVARRGTPQSAWNHGFSRGMALAGQSLMRRIDAGKVAVLALLGGIGCGNDAAHKPIPAQDQGGSGGHVSSADPGSSSGSAKQCTPASMSHPFADDDPCIQHDPSCLAPMYEAFATCGQDGTWEKNASGSIICACMPHAVTGTGGTTIGAGGTGGVTGPLVAPTFHAYVDDDGDVVLQTGGQAWYSTMCADAIRILKRAGDAWLPLRNDLPQPHLGHTDDYYLDGKYIPPSDFNCDIAPCATLAEVLPVGRALQYVQTGTKARPADLGDAGLPSGEIPFIETREYKDEIGVSVTYSEMPDCRTNEATVVPVLTSANADDAGT
jgi:hypothetical protein